MFSICLHINAMRDTDETGTITLAFRAPRALAAAAERAAAKEGLSRSAVARRALLRDLQSQSSETPDCAAADKSEPEHEHNQTAKLRRIGPAKETAC